MRNPFYNDIYEILQTSGCKGLPVGIIARCVYNRHSGLFNTKLNYEWVYQNVRFFLWAQACKPSSPIIATSRRGWYRLKPDAGRQIKIDFTQKKKEEVTDENEKREEKSFNHPTLF